VKAAGIRAPEEEGEGGRQGHHFLAVGAELDLQRRADLTPRVLCARSRGESA
jgi:hypothetical protein